MQVNIFGALKMTGHEIADTKLAQKRQTFRRLNTLSIDLAFCMFVLRMTFPAIIKINSI